MIKITKKRIRRFLLFAIIGLFVFSFVLFLLDYDVRFVSLTGKVLFDAGHEEEIGKTNISEGGQETASIRFVIPIKDAEHLDENRNFLENIYNEVKELDDVWSGEIPDKNYVRVVFEEKLTSKNHIKFYPKIIEGNPKIEVYENNGTELITEFTNIISDEYNKVFLTDLERKQDTFDLKVIDGSVEFDYIVDPTDPTPKECNVDGWANGSSACKYAGTNCAGAGGSQKCSDCTIDSCAGGSTRSSSTMIENMYINGTSFAPGDKVNVTISYGCYNNADFTVAYNNGSGWVNTGFLITTCASGKHNSSVIITADNIIGTHYVRAMVCSIADLTGATCATSTYCDNDDMNFIVIATEGDTEYPQFSSMTETPSDPATYSSEQNYQFNSTITSTNGTAGIEFNKVNYTATNSSDVFSVTISNLPANTGGYNYYWWAFGNGTSNNFNKTSTQTYTINKATLSASITNDRDDTFIYDTTPANIGIDESNSGDGDVTYNLYVNNILKGSTYSQAAAGTYNIILNSTGGANYSSSVSLDTKTLTINKAVPQGSISGTSPITYGTAGDVEGSESNSGDGDVQYKLYRDSVEVSNPDTTTLAAGTYNYVYNATSGTNYTANASIGTFELTVNQNTGNCDILLNETSPINYPNKLKVWTNCNSDFTLYRNGTEISNNSVQSLSAGTYNFTVIRTDNANYSNIYDEELFTIDQVTNGATLTLSPSNSENYGTETTASCSVDFGTAQLYRDNVLVLTPDIQTLGAGAYNYICNVTESKNWTSATDSDTLNINQISSQTSLTFDKASSQTYGTEITPTCSIITGQGSAVLTLDGNVITSGNPLTLGAGTYTFNCSLAESQNYTSSENVSDFTIDKAAPAGSLVSTEGWTITYPTETTISLSESNSGDSDLTYVIYRDGVSIGTGETITLTYGTYDYVLNTTGGANYSANANIDSQTLTVNQNTAPCNVHFNDTSPLTYGNKLRVWTDCTTSFTLYRNGTAIGNNSVQNLSASSYNFSVIRNDHINYSNTYDEQTFVISKATPSLSLSVMNNTYPGSGSINASESNNGDADLTYNLYINGNLNTSGSDIDILRNLGAGNHTITYNTTGGINFTSATTAQILEISKGTLSFSTSVSSLITYGTASDYSGSESNSGDGDCTYALERNGTQIDTGSSVSDSQILSANYYGYNYSAVGCSNYSYAESLDYLLVSKATLSGTLSSTKGWSYSYDNTATTIFYSEANTDDSDVNYTLYKNGSYFLNSTSFNLAAGTYAIVLNTTGGENYSSDASIDSDNLVISKNSESCSVYFNETSPITYPHKLRVWSNCTTSFTLYRNGTEISNNSVQTLSAGTYNFTVIRTDNVNYSNTYDEQMFVVSKATSEIAAYIDNTRNNKSVLLYREKWLNATLETGVGNIKLYYNNSLINQGVSPLANLTNFTHTGSFNVTAFYSGNENYTSDYETWWAIVSFDSAPVVTILYPENISYNSGITQLNYIAGDDISLSSCWYSTDNGATNSSPDATCSNFSGLSADEGSNTWIVYANDSINQIGSGSVTFTKDTTYPIFSNYQRAPDSPNEDQNIQVNVTVTETNKDTVILELHNGTARNYTVATSSGDEYYFAITSGNYTAHDSVTYYWYANDTAGNLNKSSQQSFTVANQIPSVSAPSVNDTTPQTNDLISCAEGSFSDNDAEDSENSREFKWYDGSAEVTGQTSQTLDLSIAGLDKTDVIKCSARVSDGYDWSAWVNSSNSATIQNSAPAITNPQTTVNRNSNGSTYNYDYDATDADGDSFIWYDNTTLFDINQTGYISDTLTEAETGTYAIRISVSDGTVNATDDFTYTINDVTNPSIQFASPTETNDSQLTRNYIQVNVTASDGKAIDTITISFYNSTALVRTNTSSTSPLFVNLTNLPDENYYFNATVNDSSGNNNHTETRTVTIDTGAPTINYISPTENSGVYKSRNYIKVNVSASDPNLDKIIVRLYNSEHTQINSDISSSSPNSAEFTGLSDGLYYYNATANDTFGNENSLTTRNITLDTTHPVINIIYPEDISYITNISELNYTYTETNPDKCWYSRDNGATNSSPDATCSNFSGLTSTEGSNTWTVYMNDTSGNEGSDSVTFNKDTAVPAVTIISPLNQTYNTNSITFNVTATDGGGISSCWYSLDAGATNVSLTGLGNYYTNTNSSMTQGSHTANFYCNDTSNNWNSTEKVTFLIDSVYPQISFATGTENNDTTFARTWIFANVDVTETNEDTIIFYLYNSTKLVNKTLSTSGKRNINWTNLPNENYRYNASVNDTAGNLNSTKTRYITLDTQGPSVFELTEYPADPATYSENAFYQFNATVTDPSLDTVVIEFGGTNYSTTNPSGNIHGFMISNLAVGTYNYRWYANDTFGNLNGTKSGSYTVNKATPSLNLTITPSISEGYGTQTTVTGSNCPSQLTCNLYRDGIIAGNPDTATLGIGVYNYTYNTTGNANYTSSTNTTNLTISQNTETCDILFNETSPIIYPHKLRVWTDCNSDFTLYKNGTEISNNSVQTLSAGTYNFTVIRTDNMNYSNTYDEEIFVISKATGVVYAYLDNSRANKTIEQFTSIYLNATLESGSGIIKLYNNGTLINQGASPLSNLTTFDVIGLYNITTFYDGNENYTGDYETWWTNVTEADVTAPNIRITYPANTTYNSVQTQLNYTVSDNIEVSKCWYSLNNGAENTTITCGQNITGLDSGEGSSTWIVYANDSKGNENSSSITFFVDSIKSAISFAPPTETSGSSLKRNYIQINATASDINLDRITIRLYNSTSLVYTNTSSESPFFINYTGLPADTYYFNATANDTAKNKNSTETRNVSLVVPSLTITKPKNQTYIASQKLPLYYFAEYENFVWYNLDNGANTTITGNTTFNTSSGSHTMYLYANNSNGETSRSMTFTIDSNKLKVNYNNYQGDRKGSSTDFNGSSYEELQNLSGIIFEDTAHGKIKFNEAINLTADANPGDNNIDINSYINISSNRIEINSTALPNFNKPATLYLYNLTFTNPRILRNGVVCPSTICTQESYTGGTLKTLKFNVTGFTVYSAEETPSVPAVSTPPGGGGESETGGGIHECETNEDCPENKACVVNKCVKLFDIKITDFESPVKTGGFFNFTYFLKGMAEINSDVEINFWIEKEGEIVTSGSDTIYIGNFEEKTETTKIFLPKETESGIYRFFVEISYENYRVSSYRTIEIEVGEGGVARIAKEEIAEGKKFEIPVEVIIIILLLLGLSGGGGGGTPKSGSRGIGEILGSLGTGRTEGGTGDIGEILGSFGAGRMEGGIRRELNEKIKTEKQHKKQLQGLIKEVKEKYAKEKKSSFSKPITTELKKKIQETKQRKNQLQKLSKETNQKVSDFEKPQEEKQLKEIFEKSKGISEEEKKK